MGRNLQVQLERTTPPTTYGHTAATAKLSGRITTTAEDTLVDGGLAGAGELLQGYLSMSLVGQTWTLKADGFPEASAALDLPYGPVLSVTSVHYLNSANVRTLLDPAQYELQGAWPWSRLWPTHGSTWPGTLRRWNAVEVVYVAGWHATDVTKVPADLRSALLLAFGSLFANREDLVVGTTAVELPLSAQRLARPWRAPRLGR